MFPYKAQQPRDDKVVAGADTRVTRRSRGSVRTSIPVIQPPPTRRPNQYRRESAFGYNPYFQPQNVSYERPVISDKRKEEDEDENKKIEYSRNWFHIREELGYVKEDKAREKFKRERARDKPKRQRERHIERDSRARSSGVEELRKSLFSEQGSQDGMSESEYSYPEDTVPPKYSLLPQEYQTRFNDSLDDGAGHSLTDTPGHSLHPPNDGDLSHTSDGKGGFLPQRSDGGLKDKQGGFKDKQGGFKDKQGGFKDKQGGFQAPRDGRDPYSNACDSVLQGGCNYGYPSDMDDDGCLTQLCRALGKCMRWLCCPFVTYQEREEHIPEKCAPLNTCNYGRG